jgi:hypothetical protein
MPELVGFVGSSHKDRAASFDAQRTVNMYPEVSASSTSKTPAKLVSAPGLQSFCDFTAVGDRGVRGMLVFDANSLFVVTGPKVLRVTAAGVATVIGAITSVDTPVSMATNGINVVFVTGTEAYVIDPAANTVTKYVDANFFGADAVYFINGSYLFNQPNSGKFWGMKPYSTTIDPLWFATAEATPDALITLAVANQEVWLFGTQTLEVWAPDPTQPFPYSKIPGVLIEQGCAAKSSVARMNGSLFFLSANDQGQGVVFRTQGLATSRISDHSLEQEIATYPVISDAIGFTYAAEGHYFYMLTFPTQNITWVYDMTSATWHQRAWLDITGTFSRHRGNCHVFFGGANIVGDWNRGKLYKMSTLLYTDDGNPLVRLRTAPHLSKGGTKVSYNNIEFAIETGVGLQSGQGSDPQVKLRWSDDYGHTFRNARMKSIGKAGNFRQRVRFLRLGQARDRVFELSYSEPTPFTVMGAYFNVEQ